MANGLAKSVPKLREIHVIRDALTKLNVAPAKTMKVRTYLIANLTQKYTIAGDFQGSKFS